MANYSTPPNHQKLIQQIKRNIKKHKHYIIENEIVFRRQQPPLSSVPFVPTGRMCADILKIYHDTPGNGAHFGRDKTTRKIQERYFWPTTIADIKNHLHSCLPSVHKRLQSCPIWMKQVM